MLAIFVCSLFFGVLLYFLFKIGTSNYDYFEKRNVKFVKPLPFIGSNGWIFRGNLIDYLIGIYNKFPTEKVIGAFDFTRPTYFLRDLDLIKQITVKDFEYFEDRTRVNDEAIDDIFNKTLVSMKGKQWREMRNSLSPMFTGSKMRLMFELVAMYGKEMVQYFIKADEQNGTQIYEVKDTFSKYTNDIIASCAFGLQCNSFENPNNEFFLIGKEMRGFQTLKTLLKFLVMRLWPKLAKILKLSFMSDRGNKIFQSLIIDTIKEREEKNIIRNDMINLLMQLKKGNLKGHSVDKTDGNEIAAVDESNTDNSDMKTNWTDEELIAQCFIFFLAGFETSSTFMSFLAYELALNPDVQMRLIEEIDSVREELEEDDILSYDILHKMKYLDMVVSEGLRKWPPAPVVDRYCVKDYVFENDDGFRLQIEKGRTVWVPIYALHMDPEFYPHPDKFDPERFSSENRKNINMNAYLPFGIGPRNCIGSRFALMEVKALFYYILSNFVFEVCEKTDVPLKLKNSVGGLVPKKPITLAFKSRK